MDFPFPTGLDTQVNPVLLASQFIRANLVTTELHSPKHPFVREYITPGHLILHLYTPDMLPAHLEACRDGAVGGLERLNYVGKISVVFQFGADVDMRENAASTIRVILSVVNQPYIRDNLIRLITYSSPGTYGANTASGFFRWVARKSLNVETHELTNPKDLEDLLTQSFQLEY
jgi:hypothetical protein